MKEQKQGGNPSGKGFAGLDEMLSDVDDAIGGAGTAAGEKTAPKAPERAAAQRRDPPPRPEPSPAPVPARDPGSGNKWFMRWAIFAGILAYLFWIGAFSDSPPARRDYRAPAVTEERPPVGTNLALSAAQLRYCTSEEIRIEGARKAVNNYVEWDVDRFNAMVDDYNSRCGEFRYRRGTLESARSDAESRRFTLEAEGRRRLSQPAGTR